MGRQRTQPRRGRGVREALGRAVVGAALAAALAAAPGSAAQLADTADTWGDPDVRALIQRAREARERSVEGIESYEGKLRQRIYVGLTALRFRRERGLFEHERIAWIRWHADGTRYIQWTGVRTAIPIAGLDTGDPDARVHAAFGDSSVTVRANRDLEADMAKDLLDETDMPGFDFDPGGDRLRFGGDDWALDPLSDTAAYHYRFASGDTLRVELPANERQVVLYEVRVRPRRADFHLVAGSLWFDAESASLVRATYKPARPFNMALDATDDEDDVPGFLRPIEADIDYVAVEYSLQELRYWLPRRFAFQGEARLGSLARIPVTVEWQVGGYVVNEPESSMMLEGELPEGWQRQENVDEDEDGNEHKVYVVVPSTAELRASPDLSEDFGGARDPAAFTASEIRALEGELEGLLPTYRRFRPQLGWGLSRGLLRYNRVEGLSVGSEATVPLTPTTEFTAGARIGTGDQTLNAFAALGTGAFDRRWSLEGYHRLHSMSEYGNPFGFVSSASHLLLGNDRGQYYRATGAALGYQRLGNRTRFEVGGFYERQRAVELGATFSVRGRIEDDTVATVLAADEIDIGGGRMFLGWFHGIDPNGLIVTGQLTGEAAGGDATYQRVSASLSASHPLPFGTAGALEVGAGTLWGDDPVQRQFFLGGSSTLRGFNTNEVRGPAFWRARAELATGFAAARIGLFTDLGWVGTREAFTLEDPLASWGIGASLLDGLFRADLARAFRGESRWKLHLYLDGLF